MRFKANRNSFKAGFKLAVAVIALAVLLACALNISEIKKLAAAMMPIIIMVIGVGLVIKAVFKR